MCLEILSSKVWSVAAWSDRRAWLGRCLVAIWIYVFTVGNRYTTELTADRFVIQEGMQIRCATCLSSQVNRRAEARVRPCTNNNNRVLSGTRLLDLIIILRVVIFLNRKYQCVSRNCAKEGAAVYLGNFIDHDNSNETSNVIGLSSIVP